MPTIRTAEIEVSARPTGAELASIKSKDGTEYLWQADPAFWPRQSPLLFPNVGGLAGGEYSHKGRTYKLGNHGFARTSEFRLTVEKPDELRFELKSGAETLAVYPFDFTLAVDYRVRANCLTVAYSVRNDGAEKMHFSIGAHPAFRAPLAAGETRADYELVFEKKETVRRHFLNADNLRSGESEPFLAGGDRVQLTPALFERGAIVLMEHASRRLSLRSRKSGRGVSVSFAGFPYLGIWSPKGEAPFVCIEPWYGIMPLADASRELAEKEGCLALGPGKDFNSAYEIRVE